MKVILIKIGLELFFRWLQKQKRLDEMGNKQNVLVNNLVAAKSVDDLLDIATDESTEDALVEIATDAAEEPVGTFLDSVLGWMFKGKK